MSKGSKPVRWVLLSACISAVAGFLATSLLRSDDAVAQGVSEPTTPVAPPAEPSEGVPLPSTQWTDGPDPIEYGSLSPVEQQVLDRADEWKDLHSGHAVHQAWSGYSAAKAAEAAVIRAERAAGIEGMANVGIE